MKKTTKRRRRSKKWISWVIILILLIAACVVGYFVWDSYFRDKSEEKQNNTTEVVEEQKIDKNDNNSETEDAVDLTNEVDDGKKIEQYDGDNPNTAEALSGVVTYAGVNGDKLMIRVNIDQYLTSGNCELTLTKNGANIYSSIASIVGSASTATCEGFDVPTGNLGGGNIKINIKLNANDKSGVIQGEVNI